ncbi:hypothetical protein SLA2020_248530 [Shorea laevis]
MHHKIEEDNIPIETIHQLGEKHEIVYLLEKKTLTGGVFRHRSGRVAMGFDEEEGPVWMRKKMGHSGRGGA